MGETRYDDEKRDEQGVESLPISNPINPEEVDVASPKRTTSPAFQFYPKDFISSSRVQRMTLTEIGAYILLLSHSWLAGGLPVEIPEIAKLVKMPAGRFAKMWPGALSECFVKRGNRLVNERLESERQKQIAYRERQAEHGKKGGRRVAFPNPSSPTKGTPSPRVGERDLQSADHPPSEKKEERFDIAFAAFRDAYPPARRKGGYLVQQAFMGECAKAGGALALMTALANHKQSEQWQDAKHIPGMDTWLTEERWRQILPPAGAAQAPPQRLAAGGRPIPEWAKKR